MRGLPRWGMVGCLTLEWVALAVWVGGMVVLSGAVIPAVFNTFGGQDSGGMFLTRAFESYHRFVIGACADPQRCRVVSSVERGSNCGGRSE